MQTAQIFCREIHNNSNTSTNDEDTKSRFSYWLLTMLGKSILLRLFSLRRDLRCFALGRGRFAGVAGTAISSPDGVTGTDIRNDLRSSFTTLVSALVVLSTDFSFFIRFVIRIFPNGIIKKIVTNIIL